MTDGTPAPLDGQGTVPGDISVQLLPDRTQLVFTGEIDVSLNAVLVTAVEEAITRGAPVDLDVRAVTFMDSAAIAMVARLAYATTVPPRVIDPPEPVRFLLEVTNVGEVVEVVTTLDGEAPELVTTLDGETPELVTTLDGETPELVTTLDGETPELAGA